SKAVLLSVRWDAGRRQLIPQISVRRSWPPSWLTFDYLGRSFTYATATLPCQLFGRRNSTCARGWEGAGPRRVGAGPNQKKKTRGQLGLVEVEPRSCVCAWPWLGCRCWWP